MDQPNIMTLNLLTLKFSGDSANLERPFQNENFKAALPHNRAAMIVGFLFYSAFGLLDWLLMPDYKYSIWMIRFAMVSPMFIATFLLSFSRSFQWYINPIMTSVSIVAGGGIIWMVFIAPPPVNYYYYAGVMLVFMWTYTFVRIPFLWATFAGWVLVILYEIAAIWISPTPFSILINNNFFFVSANIIGMIACYSLEYYARRNFFLMQQTETDRERINSINRELENRTQEYQIVNQSLEDEIDERRKMEKKLRDSEEFFRQITINSSDVLFIVNAKGTITYGSPSSERIIGYRPDELIGKNSFDLIIPEEHARAGKDFGKALRTKEIPIPNSFRIRHKNGSELIMEGIGKNLLDNPVIAGFVMNVRDVTARKRTEDSLKESEKRYRTIFESTATANIIIAEDTTILMANDNFANLCGYPKHELEGKMSWTVFIHPEDLQKMKTYHKIRRVNSGVAPSSYEFRFLNRQGDILYLFLSIALIPDSKESVASLVDLTGRKQLEIQLTQAQKIESVGRLAGGVAHDFNNMLSVIIGNTEMAMNRIAPSEPLYKSLQEIMNAAMRSADLTRQLLAFARKQTISPKVLDLNDMVTGMLKMLQRLIGENIDLGWHPGHDLWKVKIDPSQVDQLLANLMVNARDAVEKAGTITIETTNTICDAAYCADLPECIPGDYVLLAVSDNGSGMEKETLANIFEPFFTTKKEGQGTGLGLATVYGIVKQNHGFINVYSEPGQSTTFRIYIPRCVDEDRGTHDDQQKIEIQGGHETILIVEDEETVLRLSKNMLEMLGYQVLTAGSKDQALHLFQEHRDHIDLLITDVVMPNINGKELSELILAMKPDLKCLFMSGYTADIIALQGVLDEGVKFISKPFSLKDLAAKVREVLG
jgi:two-component system, cell cycle sensor histidine kinase and response regulator CckA